MVQAKSPPTGGRRRSETTKQALITAATKVFAQQGYHGVSTRRLAQAAGVNQALIGYHFGGKKGLYLAVFDHIVARLNARIGPLADFLEASLDDAPPDLSPKSRHKQFMPRLLGVCDGMLSLMLGPETVYWSQLIMREQQEPTEAFEHLYDGYMGRMLQLLTRLVLELRGDGNEKQARLIVIGIFSQVIIWRVAREGVKRQMGWQEMGAAEFEQIRVTVHSMIGAYVLM